MNEVLVREDVERRLQAWKQRLDRLFELVEARARARSLRCERRPHTRYAEWVIAKVGARVPAIEQLRVSGPRDTLELTPRSFWPVGAESVVEVWLGGTYATLVEVAARPGEASQWRLYSTDKRFDNRTFDVSVIDEMLADLA